MKVSFKHIFFTLLCFLGIVLYALSTRLVRPTDLHVSVLDVGQGDAIFVQSSNGTTMLIDGGPKGRLLAPLRSVYTGSSKRIDIFVLTNPDVDHFAGIFDLLREYDIGLVVESGTRSTSKTYKSFDAYIRDHKIPRITAHRGMNIILDEEKNIVFSILFPDRNVSGWSRNDGSIVGRLVYGSRSFMLTGDATSLTESIIRFRNPIESIRSDILKLGHHGSRTSTSSAWLDAVNPTQAIVSYGFGNTYGHPHREVVDRVEERGITLHETAQEGTITCTTDGEKLDCGDKN